MKPIECCISSAFFGKCQGKCMIQNIVDLCVPTRHGRCTLDCSTKILYYRGYEKSVFWGVASKSFNLLVYYNLNIGKNWTLLKAAYNTGLF